MILSGFLSMIRFDFGWKLDDLPEFFLLHSKQNLSNLDTSCRRMTFKIDYAHYPTK